MISIQQVVVEAAIYPGQIITSLSKVVDQIVPERIGSVDISRVVPFMVDYFGVLPSADIDRIVIDLRIRRNPACKIKRMRQIILADVVSDYIVRGAGKHSWS
ncbi:hypothetical protein D3C71_1841440 [compost metagenome]